MARLAQIKERIAECDQDLVQFRENDPEAHKALLKANEAGRAAANRWTGFIFESNSNCRSRQILT